MEIPHALNPRIHFLRISLWIFYASNINTMMAILRCCSSFPVVRACRARVPEPSRILCEERRALSPVLDSSPHASPRLEFIHPEIVAGIGVRHSQEWRWRWRCRWSYGVSCILLRWSFGVSQMELWGLLHNPNPPPLRSLCRWQEPLQRRPFARPQS